MIASANGISILDALEGVKAAGQDKWQALCPCHDDSTASLSITREGGKTLVYCHAGCPTADVVAAVGMTMADLGSRNGSAPHIDKVYQYRNGDGSVEFEVLRMIPKDFRQRRADGTPSVKGCKVLIYRLPEILRADPATPVFVVEGEKDCDNLAKLGIIATTNAGGAAQKWKPDHAKHLQDRHVVIIPDNDELGRKHAEQVRDALSGIARSVKVVELPGLSPKGDVSDWIKAGGTAAKLLELAAAVESPEAASFPQFTLDELTEKFRTLSPPVIHGVIREGETGNFIADPKVGKSWAMYALAINVATGTEWLGMFTVSQGRVLIIDNELHPETLGRRAQQGTRRH